MVSGCAVKAENGDEEEEAADAAPEEAAAGPDEPESDEPEPGEEETKETVDRAGLDTSSEYATTSLADGLQKTRSGFIQRLGKFFRGDTLDENLIEEVEEVLYTADIGTSAAGEIMGAIEGHLSSDQKQDPDEVWAFVRNYVHSVLKRRESALDVETHNPFVILVVGVNGVGKTTTIGMIASKYKKQGKKVLMVAGDTFRAAAVEQLEV